ncbi:hypothetical protein [Arcicella rosea]|uniref:Uncharacterized protein n=1 Tax=Arcicella rosea TaxID=502909 RepID=A0A841ERY3_9BACT|nr:hypothetical protein [Arcicella rosea]MBB6005044.1 hypothetical protein [Arcicella rosea]
MYCFETGAFCWKQINTGNEIVSKLLSTSNVFLVNQAIGITAESTTNFRVDANVGGSTIATGVWSRGTIQTDVSTSAYYFRSATRTANNLNIGSIVHYIASQGTLGSNNTIAEQVGFYVDSTLLAGNTNIAFKSSVPAGANNWGIYNVGTAKSYFGGNVLIGSTTDSGDKLQVTGTAKIQHLKGGTSAPTISAGIGAGTSPTISITGSDLCGTITIITGTSPMANAVLVSISFNVAYGTAPIVIIKEANVNAVGMNTVYVPANGQSNGTTATAFNLTTGPTALAASTTYMYYYQVMQ